MSFDKLRNSVLEIYKYRYVTYAFVTTNLRSRYRRSVLGFLWTVLAPMIHYIIMGLVFTVLLKTQIENYFVYYFSGAVFFAVVSSTLNRAPTAFIQNEHFIKKIYLPKIIFVQNVVIYEVVNFILSATSLLILGILSSKLQLSFVILTSILPIILVAIFLFGISAMISLATVYFRDLVHIVPAILQATFFATPIIYNKSMIPEKYHILIDINPLSYFLEAFRQPLLTNRPPDAGLLLGLTILSLTSFLIGFLLIDRFQNKIVFKL